MADTKTTALAALTAPHPLDTAMLVDVSDTSMAASGTNKATALGTLLGALTSNVISGLTLSNNTTDASNDIDIAAGVATVSDGSNWHLASLASTLVKRLDAAWAVGTNQGGLDTGSEASATWYHVWLIQRSDTGVVDVLFSTSATAPTMPTNYDRKRRIGAIYNDGSSVIRPFVQRQNLFLWKAMLNDVNAANPGTSAVLRVLSVPTGVEVVARFTFVLLDVTYGGSANYGYAVSPHLDDVAAGAFTSQVSTVGATATQVYSNSFVMAQTNTSAQVRTRISISDADIYVRINTDGWVDPRGND